MQSAVEEPASIVWMAALNWSIDAQEGHQKGRAGFSLELAKNRLWLQYHAQCVLSSVDQIVSFVEMLMKVQGARKEFVNIFIVMVQISE